MKKLWVKKRFQKTGHSRRAFGRLTHAKFSAPAESKVTTQRRLRMTSAMCREPSAWSFGMTGPSAPPRGALTPWWAPPWTHPRPP
ncbi:SPEG isoform 22 [Pan troglodytes]|uniref:SPEG isoform 22 n=1 Tax=Pan troglodytes TaxID=9598 RepID=A0A2J8NFY5_PANTR|nr:SPEG isoform 22 [Pan troglodytes]